MGPLDFFWHLCGLLAPALGVGLLVSLAGRTLLPEGARPASWLAAWMVAFLAGSAALLAGLALTGRDGTMAAYAGLVLACATSQWLLGRSWR
ncbi:hypothetical protein ACFPOE_14415 [Caenimonas terrae]|uniref:ABC transporter permease n=1 Tax=Caenimonas terrae TaxID=696074 RepID=A0ABW0NI27_9BURK